MCCASAALARAASAERTTKSFLRQTLNTVLHVFFLNNDGDSLSVTVDGRPASWKHQSHISTIAQLSRGRCVYNKWNLLNGHPVQRLMDKSIWLAEKQKGCRTVESLVKVGSDGAFKA